MKPGDRRSITSAANFPGPGPGGVPGSEKASKRTYDADDLAQVAADRVLSGRMRPTRTGPVTSEDRAMIARIAAEPLETFQARISEKLEVMADETADVIMEKLRNDKFRPDTLPALMAITIDKLQAINGRSPNIRSVNLQINNFGEGGSRENRAGLLEKLGSLRSGTPVDAVEIEPDVIG